MTGSQTSWKTFLEKLEGNLEDLIYSFTKLVLLAEKKPQETGNEAVSVREVKEIKETHAHAIPQGRIRQEAEHEPQQAQTSLDYLQRIYDARLTGITQKLEQIQTQLGITNWQGLMDALRAYIGDDNVNQMLKEGFQEAVTKWGQSSKEEVLTLFNSLREDHDKALVQARESIEQVREARQGVTAARMQLELSQLQYKKLTEQLELSRAQYAEQARKDHKRAKRDRRFMWSAIASGVLLVGLAYGTGWAIAKRKSDVEVLKRVQQTTYFQGQTISSQENKIRELEKKLAETLSEYSKSEEKDREAEAQQNTRLNSYARQVRELDEKIDLKYSQLTKKQNELEASLVDIKTELTQTGCDVETITLTLTRGDYTPDLSCIYSGLSELIGTTAAQGAEINSLYEEMQAQSQKVSSKLGESKEAGAKLDKQIKQLSRQAESHDKRLKTIEGGFVNSPR